MDGCTKHVETEDDDNEDGDGKSGAGRRFASTLMRPSRHLSCREVILCGPGTQTPNGAGGCALGICNRDSGAATGFLCQRVANRIELVNIFFALRESEHGSEMLVRSLSLWVVAVW